MSGTEDTDATVETHEAEPSSVPTDAEAAIDAAPADAVAPSDEAPVDAGPSPAATDAAPEGDTAVVDEPAADPVPETAATAVAVTRAEPTRVDRRGGTTVLLLGAGFRAGCRVRVGSEEREAEVVDAFTLRFVAPGGAGQARVEVLAPGGEPSVGEVTLDFASGPTLTGATPSEGPPEGGVEITLEGEDFQSGCVVSLFGVRAPEVHFDSTRRLRFTLPAASEGPLEGSLMVTNPDGLSDRREGLLRYRPLAPELAGLEPTSGWISGGKVLRARGADFHPKARVFFGAVPARVIFKSREQLDLEVPPGENLGLVDLTLENPDGRRTTLANAFTYEPVPAPPKIIDIFPREVSTLGRSTVRVHGDNFTDDVLVTIGEKTCTRRVLARTVIEVDVPARETPGPASLSLSLEGVTVGQEDALQYASPAAPKITHIAPRNGPTGGGTKVVIEGEGFPTNAAVMFDGCLSKNVVVKSPTLLEAVTPPNKRVAAVDVEVTSHRTGGAVAKAAFRYEATPAPVITAVSPTRGTIDGGTELGVEGKNFVEGAVILVGGAPMKTRFIKGSVLEARTPPGEDGKLVDVAVKNPDGQQAIQKRAFRYDARYRA